ncbi:MAG: Phospholipase D [Legionellaceae bacterium]
MRFSQILIFFVFSLLSVNTWAMPFEKEATYEVCFIPGQNCTNTIVKTIDMAKDSIYVMAYSFTSTPIAKALSLAYKRGIKVHVILDKSQQRTRYSSATYLYNQGIPVFIDYKPTISHNKVMIIDKQSVITGSFNFTKTAQEKNAENVIILTDKQIAKRYLANWYTRYHVSLPYKATVNKTIHPKKQFRHVRR